MLKKYKLKDGSIYWHKIYFDIMPKFLTDNHPPLGGYNYAYYLYKPHQYIADLFYEAKYFIQRGLRGYSDRDAWGWFYHHSEMMVGVLKYLRENKHGRPLGMTNKEWSNKLYRMEQGFKVVLEQENDFVSYKKFSPKAYRRLILSRRNKLMRALKYFRECYYDLWD